MTQKLFKNFDWYRLITTNTMSAGNSQIYDNEERELLEILEEPNTACNANVVARGGTNNANSSKTSQVGLSNMPQSFVMELAENLKPADRKNIMFLTKHFLSLFSQKQITNTKRQCIEPRIRAIKDLMKNIGDFMLSIYFDTTEPSRTENYVIEKKPTIVGHHSWQRTIVEFHFRKNYFYIGIDNNRDIARYVKDKYWLNNEEDLEMSGRVRWTMSGWLEPGSLTAYKNFLIQPDGTKVLDTASPSANVVEAILDLIHRYKLRTASSPMRSITVLSDERGLGIVDNLHITHPELWKKCIEGRAKILKAFDSLEWYRVAKGVNPSQNALGGAALKKKYKNRWYKIHTGVNGGKFIVVTTNNAKDEKVKKKIYV